MNIDLIFSRHFSAYIQQHLLYLFWNPSGLVTLFNFGPVFIDTPFFSKNIIKILPMIFINKSWNNYSTSS